MGIEKKKAVLGFMQKLNFIDPYVAEKKFGVQNLRALIYDLRDEGWGITTHRIKVGSDYQTYYTFTNRQRVTTDTPVYNMEAPKHSRYQHYHKR